MTGDEPGGDPPTWAEIFATLARRYGWTFDAIADMSLDQIQVAWEGLADPAQEERKKRGKAGRKAMVAVRSYEELARVLSGQGGVTDVRAVG